MARKNHNEAGMRKFFRNEYEGEFSTLKAQAKDVVRQARAVYNYPNNIKNYPNEIDRMADHFMGLPSPFHPLFRNFEIEEQLKSWGVLAEDAIPSKVSRMVDNYYRYWAAWVFETAGRV